MSGERESKPLKHPLVSDAPVLNAIIFKNEHFLLGIYVLNLRIKRGKIAAYVRLVRLPLRVRPV